MNKKILRDGYKYVLALLLIGIPLFQYLDYLPVRVWDESRTAVNAYEMYQHGNYLVPTYNEEPDMWNTKPPLMVWLQVFSMKLLGTNEFSLRLPSAFAALVTCILLLIIRDIIREKRENDNFIILYDGYSAHIKFYVNVLNEKGKNISLRNTKKIDAGETILVSQDDMKKFVENNYKYKILDNFYNLWLYEIVDEK